MDKLNAISAAGLRCIELVMSDIVSFASQYLDTEVGPKDWHALCLAAAEIKEICAEKGIKITMIQALENFEGWLETSQEREDAYERANGWIGIMRAADTDLLLVRKCRHRGSSLRADETWLTLSSQVAASDAPISKIGADHSRSIKDLRNLADMLSEYDFRLAYMNRCWSTHASRWSTAWDIVQQVRRSNIGLCLNTFHISGSQFGDPTTASGLIEKYTREQLGQRFKASLDRLSKTVPKDRIYMLQVGNAYKPKEPFPQVLGYQACPPKQRWYRDFRSLPFSGGYLPIVDVVKAVLKTGFRDWISYEVSDGGSNGHFKYYDLHAFAEAIVNRHYLMANSLCAENYTVQSLVT